MTSLSAAVAKARSGPTPEGEARLLLLLAFDRAHAAARALAPREYGRMATDGKDSGPIAVGAILRQTRERQGMDLATVEEETKIRAKYLHALEDEDWDVLPGPAYARGFIRAYAELLGLDAEVLVDEYRRRYEQPPTESYELPEPLLRGRGAGESPRSPSTRYAVIGALGAAVAAALLVLGVIAGGDGDDGSPDRSGRGERGEGAGNGGGSEGRKRRGESGEVTVKLVARSDVQACLVDNRGSILIPNQLLTEGVEEGPYVAKRFRVELDPAEARLVVDGERAMEPSPEPAAYRVTPRGTEPTEFTGRLCE